MVSSSPDRSAERGNESEMAFPGLSLVWFLLVAGLLLSRSPDKVTFCEYKIYSCNEFPITQSRLVPPCRRLCLGGCLARVYPCVCWN